MLRVREDVGRHNALDQRSGALVREAVGLRAGFVLRCGRCSDELVQKVSAAGIGALASVSAPTGHALRTVVGGGVAVCGFEREGRATR